MVLDISYQAVNWEPSNIVIINTFKWHPITLIEKLDPFKKY